MQTVVILIVAGAILLLLETILPGMIAGTIGLICLVAAVVLAYMDFGPRTGTIVLLTVCGGLAVGTLVWIKYFPDTRIARTFVSRSVSGNLGVERPELLDQTGTALTPLRPSGTALINGKRVDVVTEGPMIERDTPVKVVAVEGLRVVVRAI